ncbi:MAG: hypothetical protein ACLFQV_04250 [Vulcanimicrobiota bacterium]
MANNPQNNENTIQIPDTRTLTILYTGDIQGNAEQMAYLSTMVKQITQDNPNVILVDSGNWARGTLLSDQFKGMPMVEIMSAIGYDAVGIGEGEIAFGSKNLYMLEEKSTFIMVSSNIYEEGTGLTPYFLKKIVVFEKGPFKIAVTGLAYPEEYPATKIKVKSLDEVLPEIINEIEKINPHVTILLSRMGIGEDKKIAEKYPQFNVIVGGRDKKFLEEPIRVGNTYICQAGEKAQYLGSLEIDMETNINITFVEEEKTRE